MARMPPQERREAIVGAALTVIRTKGLAACTVRDVALQMGTSSGLIHHYFASMDDLLAAAFERAAAADLDATRRAMAAAGGPVAQLSVFFATYVRAEQDWAFQLWLDAWAEAARRPALRATSQRLNVAWQRLIEETVRRGVQQQVFVCDDPAASAWRVLSLLDGLALQAVAHRVAIDRNSVIEWSVAYAESELGLAPGSLAPAEGLDGVLTGPGDRAAASAER